MIVQLGTKLALRAGGVDGTKAVLPEPAPGRQQRVVVDDDVAVLRGLADASPLQLRETSPPCSSRKVPNGTDRGWLLLQ